MMMLVGRSDFVTINNLDIFQADQASGESLQAQNKFSVTAR